MNYTILTCEQRSDEWRLARLGRMTGSCACDMLRTVKTGEAAGRRDLRTRLVCERLTGQSQEDPYVSKEMQRGIDIEPQALAAYEALTGHLVRRTGFLQHTDLMTGCSLDGDIGNFTGILELKCPKSYTHLTYLREGKVPTDYVRQVTHNLWLSGAQWADFVSFDDRFPPKLQLVRYRIERAKLDLEAYELALRMFLTEVEKEYDDLTARMAA